MKDAPIKVTEASHNLVDLWMLPLVLLLTLVSCSGVEAIGDAPVRRRFTTLGELERLPQYAPTHGGGLKSTPFVAALSDPARFDGKKIRIKGFAGVGPDFAILGLSQESLAHDIDGHCMWLDLSHLSPSEQDDFLSRAHRRCCDLTGIIDSTRGGPNAGLDIYPCTLIVLRYTIQKDASQETVGQTGGAAEVEAKPSR